MVEMGSALIAIPPCDAVGTRPGGMRQGQWSPERCDTSREIANRAPRLRDHTWQVFGLMSSSWSDSY